MKNPITLSDFVSSQNDLETFVQIATRFVDLDGNEIYSSFEDGWYSDDAICYSDLFDAGLDVMVLANLAERYQTHAINEDGEIVLKSKDPAKLLQTIIAVYFWISEQEYPVLG
ncbi:hypothetical protein [Limosilactobacillus mucosae]|uniref:hypothetical protein n=1 Tax=Limosilactobacillus mucosae TaxID=97478 RepID=UPI0022E2C221|nr:hypothetical protein [Limosilactobacillus mucosae]